MAVALDDATSEVFQEFALTNTEIELNGAVDFFNGLPRISLAEPNYNALVKYALDLATSAGITVIAMVIVMLSLFVLLLVRCCPCCAAPAFDRKLVARRERDPKENVKHLVVSTVIVNMFIACLGLGVIGATVLAESMLDIFNSAEALIKDLRVTSLSLMIFMEWVEARFIGFDQTSLDDGSEAGEFLSTSFATLKDYIPARFPSVTLLREQTEILLNNIIRITNMLADTMRASFGAMMGLILLLFLAAIVVYMTGMFTKRRSCQKVSLQLLVLFLPLLISWIFFAVWTGVGVGAADGCRMVGEYRTFLETGVQSNTTPNVLMDTELVCPPPDEADELVAELKAAGSAVLDNPLASDTMTLILGDISNSDLDEATSWATDQAIEFINCSVLLKFSGRLQSLTCGDRSTSVIAGIQYLWWSSLISSVAIAALLIASMVDFPVMWTAYVWAPPPMDDTFIADDYPVDDNSDMQSDGEPDGKVIDDGENHVAADDDAVDAARNDNVDAVASDQ